MKWQPSLLARQQGLTLVELLVALSIGLVLLGGVYQVFVSSITVYRKNEQFSRLQENGRFAMEILGRNLRTAGYTGCSNQAATRYLNDTSFLYRFDVGLQGFDYVGPNAPTGVDALDFTPSLDAAIPLTNLVEGSDVLVLRQSVSDTPTLLKDPMSSPSASLKVFDGSFNTDDIVMLSDCDMGAIFQVSGYSVSSGVGTILHDTGGTNPGNSNTNLGKAFPAGSELIKYATTTYFIRNNDQGVPSLYRKVGTAAAEELVEGIERMQVRYGVDTNDDRQVDSYDSAAGVGDWANVVAVRVGLLVQGPIDMKAAVDDKTYDLDGNGPEVCDPPDERRMRRVFKSTFVLRNRAN